MSDWLEQKAGGKRSGLHEGLNNSTISSDQTGKTTSKAKHYGGVKKSKQPSTIKLAIKHKLLKKAKHFTASKQPFFYDTLIAMAIRSSPIKALNVAEIHAYIAELYPYFKACPGSLKASIIKTLSSSACFEKLGEPCQHYWTLASKARAGIREEPKEFDWSCGSHSQQTNQSFFPAHPQTSAIPFSQPTYINTPPTPIAAYSQAAVSTENFRQSGLTHDERLRHYIHNSPLYPRVSVITPTGGRQWDEAEVKIGEVFSLNSQPTTSPCSPTRERSSAEIIPYHPCTFRVCHCTHDSPNLSSSLPEDKERFEDAQ